MKITSMINKSYLWFAASFICAVALVTVLVPPPRPASAQFADQSTYGGTSTGSANAQAVTIANYTQHVAGVVLRFVPGFTNTGPATINVTGLGAVALTRPTSIGVVALSGSELQSGEMACVTYNGTNYQLSCNVDMTPIGRTVEYRGSNLPRGSLIEDGSCVSRATYAPLFSVISTTYGACDGTTTFALPDSRGTNFSALDNQGANGAANRITSAGSGCTATSVVFCGSQSATLSTGQLPVFTPSGSVSSSITFSGPGQGVGLIAAANSTPDNPYGGGGASIYRAQQVTSPSVNSSFSGNSIGSGQSHPTLNPTLLGRRSIKY